MISGPAIIDTNVLVAGLITADATSPTARILDGMLRGRFPFVLSTVLLIEYRTVLLRERVRALHGLTPGQIDDILTEIVANAIVREGSGAGSHAPDPGDQHLWDLLEATPRAVLVTGDAALARAAPAGASILSPREWAGARETRGDC